MFLKILKTDFSQPHGLLYIQKSVSLSFLFPFFFNFYKGDVFVIYFHKDIWAAYLIY